MGYADGASLYAFVGSNPLVRVDPFGTTYVGTPGAGLDDPLGDGDLSNGEVLDRPGRHTFVDPGNISDCRAVLIIDNRAGGMNNHAYYLKVRMPTSPQYPIELSGGDPCRFKFIMDLDIEPRTPPETLDDYRRWHGPNSWPRHEGGGQGGKRLWTRRIPWRVLGAQGGSVWWPGNPGPSNSTPRYSVDEQIPCEGQNTMMLNARTYNLAHSVHLWLEMTCEKEGIADWNAAGMHQDVPAVGLVH
jgi:hypothetical protein